MNSGFPSEAFPACIIIGIPSPIQAKLACRLKQLTTPCRGHISWQWSKNCGAMNSEKNVTQSHSYSIYHKAHKHNEIETCSLCPYTQLTAVWTKQSCTQMTYKCTDILYIVTQLHRDEPTENNFI